MPGYFILADISGNSTCSLHEFYLGDIDEDPLYESIGMLIKTIEKKKKDLTINRLEKLYGIKIPSKEYVGFIKNKIYKKAAEKTFNGRTLSFNSIGILNDIWGIIDELEKTAKTSLLPFASFTNEYDDGYSFLVIDISNKEKSPVLLWNDDLFEHVSDSIGDFLKILQEKAD